jgi:succinyl-diaminopimelate desuccinylase
VAQPLDDSSTLEDLQNEPELSAGTLAATLSTLVSTPSVNPGMTEHAMLEAVSGFLTGIGCTLTTVEFAPGRPSLAAVLEGSEREPRLVLNGHMDTVAIDDATRWSAKPFAGEIRDGAVWGRGSLDMKGGLAAQIACARTLAKRRASLKGSLVLHFAAGEECGEAGTLSLLERGFTGDWGITTEPTDLTVATAERGVGWFLIRVNGRSSHGSRPDAGLNPLAPVTALLERLARYASSLQSQTHPLLGSPTCSVTRLHAGAQHNALPDYADITVDRRLLPGEAVETVQRELDRLIDDAGCRRDGYTSTIEVIHHPFAPAETSADTPFVELMQRTRERVVGERGPITGTTFGSDVRNLIHDAGMEAVTFGAGDPANCHCVDEHLPISDLRQAALTLALASTELLT